MSDEKPTQELSETTEHYAIRLADGTLLQGSPGPWNATSKKRAADEIYDELAGMKRTRIPEAMWPRVVTVKKTITWHDIEELKEDS